MKNHSPAPWHHMEEREQIIDAEGNIVVYETNTSAADALLITAAPDLLAALEMARSGLQWYQDEYPEAADGSDDEAMAEIDAAIAKATGAVL